MGLNDLLQEQYEVGNVHSSKDLEDFPFNRQVLEIVLHNISPGHVDAYFKGSEKELAALVEYIDFELQSESPFGYTKDGEFVEGVREIRAELIGLM